MNAVELFRTGRGLTFEALKDLAGYPARMTVFRHCKAAKIPGDAALVYHRKLGIPLKDLRPDLWPALEEGQALPAAPIRDASELLAEPPPEILPPVLGEPAEAKNRPQFPQLQDASPAGA